MRYKQFRIKNFKGIKDTTVDLKSVGGAGVFAFVGLNESGKTTILEAMHSFSPDSATNELVGGTEGFGVAYKDRVPRHLISTFTGDISVTATLVMSAEERDRFVSTCETAHDLKINLATIPLEVSFERQQRFKDGDYKANFFSLRASLQVRSGKQKKWREPTNEESIKLRDTLYNFTPDIAYFPTFVFDFPSRSYLTERGGAVDRFYRRVFQDILDYDGHGHTIEKDIIRRVQSEKLVQPWLSFLGLWGQHDDRGKIQHVMDRASSAVTKLVFGRWNKIFSEDTKGKEVVISFEVVEGEVIDAQGRIAKTDRHDIYIQFQIRDGTRRFNVNDRSLGFRWFFAFMLFTQFRVARANTRSIMFLFDEPAANLHAAAQQKLIDSFPEIARGDHMLAYTTHSHYMIEPKWLEQTFIVTNSADTPSNSVVDAVSLDDESLDVKAQAYRSFVNDHPSQTSYFQPILDRLDVVPSRFDAKRDSIVLEGRSDYYVLRYAEKLLNFADLPLLPGLGAGTFGALAALHVGWNLKFLFVLDSDHQGTSERDRYIRDFGIPSDRVVCIGDLVPSLAEIEDLLDDDARSAIQLELSLPRSPTKNQIRRFFQERLANGEIKKLSPGFEEKSKALILRLKETLG